MKCVLVFIMMHYCYAMGLNTNLTIEMLLSLNQLKNVTGGNISYTNNVFAPDNAKIASASSCLGVFKKELKNVLHNAKVPEEGKVFLRKLKANLEALNSGEKNGSKCPFSKPRFPKSIIGKYITFLQKLNSEGHH